jgi:aminomethyltransferase
MSAFNSEKGVRSRICRGQPCSSQCKRPGARGLIDAVLGTAPGRFANTEVEWGGARVWVAGTGYTGEDGVEICTDPRTGVELMRVVVDAGAIPCGLGARDTLRLEAGLALWGEDIDETTTPLEAGLGFGVSFDHDFIGKERLLSQRDTGLPRRLAGFVLERDSPARIPPGDIGGEGTVTSGNISPMLDTGIGLAYISPPAAVGERVEVRIRDRSVPGHIAKAPFHENT